MDAYSGVRSFSCLVPSVVLLPASGRHSFGQNPRALADCAPEFSVVHERTSMPLRGFGFQLSFFKTGKMMRVWSLG